MCKPKYKKILRQYNKSERKTSYKYLCPVTKGNELVLNLKGSKEKMIYLSQTSKITSIALHLALASTHVFAERALRTLGIYPSVFSA